MYGRVGIDVVVNTMAAWIHARHEAGARGTAVCRHCQAVAKQDSFPGEPLRMWHLARMFREADLRLLLVCHVDENIGSWHLCPVYPAETAYLACGKTLARLQLFESQCDT